jgi:hypothetical protein
MLAARPSLSCKPRSNPRYPPVNRLGKRSVILRTDRRAAGTLPGSVALYLSHLAPAFLPVGPHGRCRQYVLRTGCILLSETIIKHSVTFHVLPTKAGHLESVPDQR